VTTATTRQPISSQCSRPENSFRRSAWNGVQGVGVLTKPTRPSVLPQAPISAYRGEAISSTRSPGITPTGASACPHIACGKYKNALSRSGATLVTFNRKSHGGSHHEHNQAGRTGSTRTRNRGGTSSKWREKSNATAC
jgi:hypothetical protein